MEQENRVAEDIVDEYTKLSEPEKTEILAEINILEDTIAQ
ncbi:hypothetical protein EAL2_c11250 [Peptoclostridium acidaminophilum DSM 3953]|uniref:Uncharacterized protein n=2 Tax=Peptoclostridium acidaminophilum TaxID=1731 RepID=W8TF14_PEPAC|nr:hypothetical protein EAL2_c11250 [Peptoclostridium acidaminophilum DSM 3953]